MSVIIRLGAMPCFFRRRARNPWLPWRGRKRWHSYLTGVGFTQVRFTRGCRDIALESTFDLIHGTSTVRPLYIEIHRGPESGPKNPILEIPWLCGLVGAAWLVPRTLGKAVECRLTRIERGGEAVFRAQRLRRRREPGGDGTRRGHGYRLGDKRRGTLSGYARGEQLARDKRLGLLVERVRPAVGVEEGERSVYSARHSEVTKRELAAANSSMADP